MTDVSSPQRFVDLSILLENDVITDPPFMRPKITYHTHLGAPWHFHPTMDGGARAITIDEVPLDWYFRPGVKLDSTACPTATS